MAKAFVTGGTGFIGREVVRRLAAAGHGAQVLTRSTAGEPRIRELGGLPVHGDLGSPDAWQQTAAAADWVIHLAQPLAYDGTKVTRKRAEADREARLVMDRNLFEALDPSRTKQIIYIAGTSYYGNQGRELRDETTPPRPRGWGPYLEPAIHQLDRYAERGLSIVTAFPGWVYRDGSWFRQFILDPLRAGKKLTQLGGEGRWASPVHLSDCAGAITFLCEGGMARQRYFIVDDRPVPMSELGRVAARALGTEARVRKVPVFVARLLLGPVLTDSQQSDGVFSNARPKRLGFVFAFPPREEGVPEVVANARM